MKFKFCGDNDCQDWILAQIVLLSKLTLIKFKIILNAVIDNILKQTCDLTKISKITTELKFSDEETQGMVAALNFILLNSTINSVDDKIVCDELQQLGLPKEHSITFCKLFSDNYQKIKEFLSKNKLKNCELSNFKLEQITCSTPSDLLLNLECHALKMTIENKDFLTKNTKTFHVPVKVLDHLISELHQANDIMTNLNNE